MKIEIEINEAKLLEIAKTASINEMPQAIFYEAKKQAVDIAVNEIKSKLVDKPYYGGKETLYSEVRDYLYKQIESIIKQHIETKFSEKEIEKTVSRFVDKTFQEWIEKKIYEKLNQAKADINFYSERELMEGREEEAEANQHQ